MLPGMMTPCMMIGIWRIAPLLEMAAGLPSKYEAVGLGEEDFGGVGVGEGIVVAHADA